MRPIGYAAILVIAALVSGCATIIHGTTQKVPVSSSPPGVKVVIGENTVYTTPTVLDLSRKDHHTLQFQMDGYEIEMVKLESVTSGVVMGNILLGGLIGWGVDAASGGQYRLVPETVHVTMRARSQRAAFPDDTPITAVRTETLEGRLQQLKGLREKELITDEEYQATRKRVIESYAK